MSNQVAGFPPGIHPGGLVQRVLAHVIDMVLPSLLILGATAAYLWGPGDGVRIALTVVCLLLVVGWAVFLWWRFATRGAGVGMSVMKLELVSVENGEPIGWSRYLIRMLVFFALSATSVGLIVMLILLVMNGRRQGWHDLAARSVVIQARDRSPQSGGGGAQQHGGSTAAPQAAAGAPVGLPPTLSGQPTSGFAPTPGQGYGGHQQEPEPAQGRAPTYQPTGHGQPDRPPGAGSPGSGQQGFGASSPWGPSADTQSTDSQSTAARSTGPGSPGSGSTRPPSSGPSPFGRPPSEPPIGQSAGGPALVQGVPTFSEGVSDEVESTRLAPNRGTRRPQNQGWAVMLGDGRLIEVESLVLLGRNPQPRAGEDGAELIQVSDTSRTVSKTHIAVGVDNKGMYVMDRGSTNGSAIAGSNGTFEPCAPGDQVRVREGQVVSFGEQRFEIRRTYGG